MDKQRDLSLDFIKGILIFLVVLGHCLNELHTLHSQGGVNQWIYSFHMPLFMFVSGWFAWHTMNNGYKYIILKKSYRLALPALIWSSVIFVQRMDMGESVSLRLFYDSCRGMWFLWCLYALFLLSGIIWKSKYKGVLAAVLTCTSLALCPWYPNDFLKHFKIPLYFPIFFIGAYLSERLKGVLPPRIHMGKYSLQGLMLFVIVVCYICLALQDYKDKQTNWAFLGLFATYITSLPIYLILLVWIYGKIAHTLLAKGFCVLGCSTLGIYALNERLIIPLSYFNVFPLQRVVQVLLISVAVTALCYGGTVLIRRVKVLKIYLLGEK